MDTGSVDTALDLEEGLALLESHVRRAWSAREGRPVTDGEPRRSGRLPRGVPALPRRARGGWPCTAAYELGRRGLVTGVSMLELVRIHHEVLVDALTQRGVGDLGDVADAAAAFLAEVLGPFEMTHRAVLDRAGEAAAENPRRRPSRSVGSASSAGSWRVSSMAVPHTHGRSDG